MTATNARRARTATRPTTEPTPVGTLVEQARNHGSDTLDRIKAAMDVLTQQAQAVGIVSAHPDAVIDTFGERLADTVLKTGAVPDDITNQITAAVAEHESRVRQVRIMDHARRILKDQHTTAIRDAAEGGLRWLDTQLNDLLTAVNELRPDLDGVTTAEDALTLGREDAYRQIRAAVQQYAEIRKAQKVLTADARSGQHANLDVDLRNAGLTRTPSDEKYCVAVGLIEAYQVVGSDPRTVYTPPPWPGAEGWLHGAMVGTGLPSTEPVAYLLWIAARGDAWVPTGGELNEALRNRKLAIERKTPIDILDTVSLDGKPDQQVRITEGAP